MAASSYDHTPYTSLAFPQTHPDHLAGIARIFRLSPSPVGSCRVLEIGCASGGNLIPMAYDLPGSEFVGIDLSQRQVEDAQTAIAALGLRNIRIEQASILDVDDGWGRFDYIISHGVFSWIEPDVQDALLATAARNLTPDGLAYVSYNTYPGWHAREAVRHMMRYHASQFSKPQEQIEQARAFVKFLVAASDATRPYNQLLKDEADRVSNAPDSYIFHEHLERTNLPLYFHQFVDRAERAGLQYLSEAVISEMLTSHFPPQIAATLERISPDLLHLEQYMDFIRNRQFRQTILCHKHSRPVRTLSPEILGGLLVSSAAVSDSPSPDLTPGVTVVFSNGTQRATISSSATKAALTLLMERWPCAIDVAELCELALDRASRFASGGDVSGMRRAMLEELFGGVMYGLIELHTVAPQCTNRPSDAPRAHGVAAFQAQSGNLVVNAHHTMFELDAMATEVLKLSNGERVRAEMIAVFVDWFTSGRLSLENDGQPVTDLDEATTMLASRLEVAIGTLTRSALLVA